LVRYGGKRLDHRTETQLGYRAVHALTAAICQLKRYQPSNRYSNLELTERLLQVGKASRRRIHSRDVAIAGRRQSGKAEIKQTGTPGR
jgi:hypothetical protein